MLVSVLTVLYQEKLVAHVWGQFDTSEWSRIVRERINNYLERRRPKERGREGGREGKR